MQDENEGFAVHIAGVLKWQLAAVLLLQVVVVVFQVPGVDVLLGGVLVMLSTWHVYQSVQASQGEKGALMMAAGLRFVLLLAGLVMVLFVFGMNPLLVVAGMVVAYAALYLQSLLVIYKRMKGS